MFITTKKITTEYQRASKLGKVHSHKRVKTIVVFRCDSCNELFERPQAKMETKRRSNAYFHCCSKCDSKRFAQRKGVERRFIWDKPASSTDDISKL